MNAARTRQSAPVHLSLDVILHFHGKSYGPCPVTDLSPGKLNVPGQFEENVGDYCEVIFMQTGSPSDLTLKALAIVNQVDEEGIGIEFYSMTFDTYMFLQATLLNAHENILPEEVEQWRKI